VIGVPSRLRLIRKTGTLPRDRPTFLLRPEKIRPEVVVYYESMKRKLIENLYMSVGVMEDYKLRDLRASHTDLYIQRRDLRLSLVRGAFFSVFPLFFPTIVGLQTSYT
jgi:hypothetical protein